MVRKYFVCFIFRGNVWCFSFLYFYFRYFIKEVMELGLMNEGVVSVKWVEVGFGWKLLF